MSYFEKWKVAFALQEEMDIGRAKYQMLKEKGNSIFTMKDDSSIQFLYEEMNKDLSRLYPKGNLHFFQNKLYLTTLKNVLYIYCQLNSDVSYRQGMHDIAAIVLYTYLRQYGCNVLYTIFGPARAENSYKMPRLDQVNVFHMVQGGTAYLQHNFVMQEPPLPFDVEQYMEHDVFIMFEAIMGYMKPLYQVVGSVDHGEMEKAVVLDQCRQMQHELLRKYDPNLCHYLQVYEIIPETYAVRWIKLMLGREFYLDDAIILWDEIFQHLDSQNTSFDSTQDCGPPYLQYICVAMLVYYSKELQNKDNTECLKLLMNEGNWKVSTVVQIAKGLYNPMLLETGDTNVVKFNQGALGVVLTQAPAPFEGHLAVRGFTASSSEMKGQAEASGKIKKMDIITSINGVFASELSPDTIKEHISCVGRPIFIGFSTPSSSHDKNVVISEEPLCIKSPSFLQGEECFGTADASFYYPLLNDDGLVISRYIAGKMYLTNYRLIFSQYMSENITWQVPVFSILSTVGVDATNESQASSLFQEPTSSYQLSVQCKDVRTAKFSFTKFAEYSQIYRCLNALIYPSDIMQAFCFRFRPFITKWEPTPIFDIRSEYNRLGLMGHLQFRCMRQKKYSLCASYPQYLIVPHHMTDDDLARVAAYRSKERFPAITWIDSKTGAVIARCSQPLVGLKNARNAEDEKLVQLLCTSALAQTNFNSRYCIMDARGQLAAVGNKAMGKGTEVPANYKGSYLVFMNIDNIHSIRQSYNALSTIFVDSDADDSSNYYGRIEASGWLKHIRMVHLPLSILIS